MSSVIHICTVCFEPSESHREDEDFMECGCEERHFPPLCCPGCDCGSYEAAHSTEPEPPAEGEGVDTGLWAVEVWLSGVRILTIEPNAYGGKELSAAEREVVRDCARRLLSFVGTEDADGQFNPPWPEWADPRVADNPTPPGWASLICDGCRVLPPHEHRCHGGTCTCGPCREADDLFRRGEAPDAP